jgi:hypothetical protein
LLFRLDRRHPQDVFDVFWPRLAGLFARCHGHTADGEAVNVFTEVVPRARHRSLTVPPSRQESAPPPSQSLLERRLAGRPDLDVGALRHLRDSLTLAIPSRQVSDPGFFLLFLSLCRWLSSIWGLTASSLVEFRYFGWCFPGIGGCDAVTLSMPICLALTPCYCHQECRADWSGSGVRAAGEGGACVPFSSPACSSPAPPRLCAVSPS